MANRIVYQEFWGVSGCLSASRFREFHPAIASRSKSENSSIPQRRKGKTATVITGLQDQTETLESLLKQLKNQCGAGGTLKDGEIEIQGAHTQKICKFF